MPDLLQNETIICIIMTGIYNKLTVNNTSETTSEVSPLKSIY